MWTDLELNPDLCGEKPVANQPNNGKATEALKSKM
jgi:hypothetical protein